MSAEASGFVWKNSPYNGASFVIHLAIADVVNDAHGNEFWMSIEGLARKARVSRSTAFSCLGQMVDEGHLEVVERGGPVHKPTRYRFKGPEIGQEGPESGLASAMVGPLTKRTQAENTSTVQNLDPCELKELADPDCFECHGSGTSDYPVFGARCACTKPWVRTDQDIAE